MPAHPPRVLWVALDACDERLARRFAAEGDMPNLAGLLATSSHLRTSAPTGVFVSALWPTVFTARDPSRHGYHCWDTHSPDGYAYRQTTPDEIDGTPFWVHLSNPGHRVAVLDVPHSAVRAPVHGLQLVEWGCHDRHFGSHSYPPDLLDELDAEFGPHPIGRVAPPGPGLDQFAPCDYQHRVGPHRTDAETEALWRDLLEGIERKRDASLSLLDREPWPLFLAVLGESHCAGHQLWHLSDPGHPRHDPALAQRLGGDPLREVYRRLDAVLGDHLARAGAETTVLVQLSHGMGPHFDGTHLLSPVLERLEQLADGLGPRGWRRTAARALDLTPARVRRAGLRLAAPTVRRRVDAAPGEPLHHPAFDLPASPDRLWWASPNNTVSGGIRLNVLGREPEGRILPEEYPAVLRWLRSSLLDLIDVDTGRPCVRDVLFTDEVYDRRGGDAFPDLFVEWERSHLVERVWSPRTGVLVRTYDHWRTGDHHPSGLVLWHHPGAEAVADTASIRAVDLAPTVAAVLGVTLPDVDGEPRHDLLGSTAPVRRISGRPHEPTARRPWRRAGPADGLANLARAVEGVRRRVDLLDSGDTSLRAAVERLERDLGSLERSRRTDQGALHERLLTAERLAAIATTTAWLGGHDVPEGPLVSVITPTYDRAEELRGAIASMLAQTYRSWEMVVVDDGSSDHTAEVVANVGDDRIRYLRIENVGCSAARNVGLDAARGELIAYLDSDNRFDPGWLKAVVWSFGRHPEATAAYGARLIDDANRVNGLPEGGDPWIHFAIWDRAACEEANLVDMNVIAHRADPTIRFDPAVRYFGDWDLLLKLTDGGPPIQIPVVAAHYTTTAARRLSDVMGDDEIAAERERVRRSAAARRTADQRPPDGGAPSGRGAHAVRSPR